MAIAITEVKIVSGVSKKTGNPWTALRVTVGEWSTLIFPKTTFEMDYLKKNLAPAE